MAEYCKTFAKPEGPYADGITEASGRFPRSDEFTSPASTRPMRKAVSRFSSTVIGLCVNLASRIGQLNKTLSEPLGEYRVDGFGVRSGIPLAVL